MKTKNIKLDELFDLADQMDNIIALDEQFTDQLEKAYEEADKLDNDKDLPQI